MTDTIEVKPEQDFKEVEVDEGEDLLVKQLKEENKFLRNVVSFFIEQNKVLKVTPKDSSGITKFKDEGHIIEDLGDARLALEAHFEKEAVEKRKNEKVV